MTLRTIVVATDFSAHGDAAVARACRLAASEGASLHVVHVAERDPRDEERHDLLSRLAQSVSAHRNQQDGGPIHYELLDGVAHRRILNYSQQQQADLIVVGSRGRTGLAQWAMGSVTDRILRSADREVLVVQAENEQLGASATAVAAETADVSQAEAAIPSIDAEVLTPSLDLLKRAVSRRATDIHLSPCGSRTVAVRFRIDGRLEEYCQLDHDVAQHLQQQLKVMASLDIADPFRPQEGNLELPTSWQDLTVRLTCAPVAGGEAIALRIFTRETIYLPLSQLGLSATGMEQVHEMLQTCEGLILVTGPTNSGKSTTVYSMLETLANGERHLVSIEDPVEFPVPFIGQMRVDPKHGITIASGLRTLLRMDPDVIFVGEIRDQEAARIAMRAASSGHYVLSTLHTRDVASTFTALRDLGIDDRSAAGNLTGIINQRLVRRLCRHCAIGSPLSAQDQQLFTSRGLTPPTTVWQAGGCDRCRQTGYLGRIGVFEVARLSEAQRAAVIQGIDEGALRESLHEAGVASLLDDALRKVADGTTSLDEATTMRWL